MGFPRPAGIVTTDGFRRRHPSTALCAVRCTHAPSPERCVPRQPREGLSHSYLKSISRRRREMYPRMGVVADKPSGGSAATVHPRTLTSKALPAGRATARYARSCHVNTRVLPGCFRDNSSREQGRLWRPLDALVPKTSPRMGSVPKGHPRCRAKRGTGAPTHPH